MSTAGARLFAQYAYPPNELGYCGPAGAAELLCTDDPADREARARAFDGAWVYLELLAEAVGCPDPLDPAVVEAYWVGNDLLDRVDPALLVGRLEQRFRGQLGGSWRDAGSRATAHHSFQVFEVYPWAGLLLQGRPPGPAVNVLDRCRIRVGEVREVHGESVTVHQRPLTWDGSALREGDRCVELVRWSVDGASLIAAPEPGDVVALHWDWVCAVVDDEQVRQIVSREARTLLGLDASRDG